jgi:hypothetical protein
MDAREELLGSDFTDPFDWCALLANFVVTTRPNKTSSTRPQLHMTHALHTASQHPQQCRCVPFANGLLFQSGVLQQHA